MFNFNEYCNDMEPQINQNEGTPTKNEKQKTLNTVKITTECVTHFGAEKEKQKALASMALATMLGLSSSPYIENYVTKFPQASNSANKPKEKKKQRR